MANRNLPAAPDTRDLTPSADRLSVPHDQLRNVGIAPGTSGHEKRQSYRALIVIGPDVEASVTDERVTHSQNGRSVTVVAHNSETKYR